MCSEQSDVQRRPAVSTVLLGADWQFLIDRRYIASMLDWEVQLYRRSSRGE